MSGYTSTTSLPPTAIRIGSSNELNELSKFAFPCSVRLASSLMLGMSISLFFIFIALLPYKPVSAMKATVCVKTGEAHIIYANTEEIARINPDTNVLVEYGTTISAESGVVMITHFDGSTEELSPYTQTTLAFEQAQKQMGVLFWLQRAFYFGTESFTDFRTVASVNG